jgi:hypothetical protein
MENQYYFFEDEKERHIATLGKQYLEKNDYSEHGCCVLSDKRIYTKGKHYFKEGLFWNSSSNEKVIDIGDVTGSGFTEGHADTTLGQVFVLGMFVCSIISGMITNLIMEEALWRELDGMVTISKIIAILPVIIAILKIHQKNFKKPSVWKLIAVWTVYVIMIVIFGYCKQWSVVFILSLFGFVPLSKVLYLLFGREKMYTIAYLGGQASFIAKDYSEEEINTFMEALMQMEENYVPQKNEFVSAESNGTNINVSSGSTIEELKKYKELLDAGAITQEEFIELKSRVMK